MKNKNVTARTNLRLAHRLWGQLSAASSQALRQLTQRYALSVSAGDLQFLNGGWYVTHSGLLQLALRRGCRGIETVLQEQSSDPVAARWVFRATVYKSAGSRGFVGYGDADPSNISSVVRGAEMRVAETRAVNRALRKAYGIGLCSVEELGALPSVRTSSSATPLPVNGSSSLNGNGQPRLRDQLCLLIRQFKLDPSLVKSYAADFCGTEAISDASRESVETFISHLKKVAEENRDALICKLNSYSARVEPEK